jgi:uncharacterized protein YdeI (YjbR/CyaY-like superfamily)
MGEAHDKGEPVHAETAADWAAWLERHHERGDGVWLTTWRPQTGRPVLGYQDAVVEALRFGWIDSKAGKGDTERSQLWFSPRRKGSPWARTNKARIERLEREGRMAPAGIAVLEAARADGSWTKLDAVEDLTVPHDLAAAFDAYPGSRERWDAFPPSARRGILEWIVQARRAPTRAKRVEETARLAATGKRANQ